MNRKNLLRALPLFIILVGLTLSFLHGWYIDSSKPHAGGGWADQTTYALTSDKLTSPEPLLPGDLHFAIGYPMLGVLGKVIIPGDPFMIVSLVLLLGSGTFIFLAIRQLLNVWWAVGFIALLFYWDGVARSFHFASELFAIPWNNQVLFFTFSFFLWLLIAKTKKPASYRIAGLAGLVGGLSFVTREESILFIAPLLAGYLFITKTDWRKWLLSFAVVGLCFVPQAIVKTHVLGSVTESGHDYSYAETISKYFDVDRFINNVSGVLVDSGADDTEGDKITRPALLQVAPWLWLGLAGLWCVLFMRRYPLGVKIFVLVSLLLMFFYLSGINMSPQKLAFHCLRYISPGFIALYLGVIIAMIEGVRGARYLIRHRPATLGGWYDIGMSKLKSSAIHWLQATVLAVPAALAGFSVVSVALLLIGQFHTHYVLTAGIFVSALIFLVVWSRQKKKEFYPSSRETTIYTLVALLFAAIWVGYNLSYNSEHVFINRDPGIYAVTAKFLKDQPSLELDKVSELSEHDGFSSSAAGFDTSRIDNNELFAQGAHLLPALLGFTARFFGNPAIFNMNVVFGGIALLTFFIFSLNFIKARFAFLGMVSLGVLLPFIYFSRDTYTEILALTFTFGALTLVHFALLRKDLLLWFLAGLTLGAGVLTRIDAYISIAAMIVFAIVLVALSVTKKERVSSLKQMSVFAVGTSITALVGFLDVKLLASGYFFSEWRYLSLELYLIVALLVISVPLVYWCWRKGNLESLNRLTIGWRAKFAVVALILFWVFMGSRFLWMDNPTNQKVAEMIVLFTAAYLGPIMLLLGVIGLAVMARRILSSKNHAILLMPFFIVTMTTALLYITKPSIASDHVWASRRLLPIVLPGLIFAGMYVVHHFYLHRAKKRNQTGATKEAWIIAAVVAAAVLSPLVLTHRFATLSSFKQYSALEAVCDKLPDKSVVIWVGRAGMDAPIATRAYCQAKAVRYISENGQAITREKLVMAQNKVNLAGGVLVVGSYEADLDLLPEGSTPSLVAVRVTENAELKYNRPPFNVVRGTTNIYTGIVEAQGTIRGINQR